MCRKLTANFFSYQKRFTCTHYMYFKKKYKWLFLPVRFVAGTEALLVEVSISENNSSYGNSSNMPAQFLFSRSVNMTLNAKKIKKTTTFDCLNFRRKKKRERL